METALSVKEYLRLFSKPIQARKTEAVHGTIEGRRVLVYLFVDNYILKFTAYVHQGPVINMFYGDTTWEGDHPDQNLIRNIGNLIENALA
ncbi:MAG: hypothetical protein WCF67_01145 [Chitinophagaceae bacterium]